MKKIILIGAFLIVSLISSSQVKSVLSATKVVETSGIFNSPPPSKSINIQIDAEEALNEAKEEEELGLDLPFRFGKGVEVSFTLQNSGEWFETEGGRVWKLKIKSAKAYSLSLIFSKLLIHGRTEIYIYNEEGSMIYGPITSESTTPDWKFSSDIIEGDALVLELFEPEEEKGKNVLQLARVVHGFRDIFQPTNFGNSNGSCQDDVSCNSNWATQSNGVAMIILANMERLCSGSLINNACQDFTPNILTAFHCVDIGNDINNIDACSNNEIGNGTLTTQEIENAENWVFRFQYKRPNCNTGTEPSNFYTFQRATFRAGWFNTDFALVEMNQNPINGGSGSGIRYLGWERVGTAPTSGAILGHPKGDVMKISTFGNAVSNNTQIAWTLCPTPLRRSFSPVNTHWTTTINDGALEGGSSGGPFFDQNGRVVGQIHGGVIGCAPKISHAGRFDVSWTGGGTDDTRLSTWLTNDPNVTQTNTVVIPTLSGPSLICSSGATFTITGSVGSIVWIPGPGLTITSQNNTSCTFSATGNGSSWVGATLVTNCGSITLPQKDVWRGAPVITGISGPTTTPNNQWANYYSSLGSNLSAPTEYNWVLNPLSGNYVYNFGFYAIVVFYNPGYYRLQVQAKNACTGAGYGPIYETSIYVYDALGLAITPNPATGEATIRLVGENKDAPVAFTEWDCEVYDPMQSLKEKKTKLKTIETKINTAGWKEGVYIVRAKVGEKILSEKLVVKH